MDMKCTLLLALLALAAGAKTQVEFKDTVDVIPGEAIALAEELSDQELLVIDNGDTCGVDAEGWQVLPQELPYLQGSF